VLRTNYNKGARYAAYLACMLFNNYTEDVLTLALIVYLISKEVLNAGALADRASLSSSADKGELIVIP
jgi:hypothetical protein